MQPARKRIGPSPADVAAQVECHLGSSGSAYRVWIVDEVEDGNWLLYVKMDGRPVVFSPMAVTIRPGVSAKESVLSGPGLRRAVAGVPADVFLSLRMQNDVPALDCREAAMLVLVETWASSDVAEDEPGHRRADSAEADSDAVSSAAPSHRSLTGELVTCSKGEYHFSYTATAAGNYSLSVLIGRQKRLVGGGDFNVVVVPGLLSPQHCEVEGGMLGLGAALPYGATVRFRLLLRDALGNRISCGEYEEGVAANHSLEEVVLYHQPGEDMSAASWEAAAVLSACIDAAPMDVGPRGGTDGTFEVEFRLPRTAGEESANRETTVDIQIRVNGRRLKQGPYPTLIRPARLSPADCVVEGAGLRGAQPAQDQRFTMRLVNELGENMTTCGSLADIVGLETCVSLAQRDACRARADCEWVTVPPDGGACSAADQRELVELYLSATAGGGAQSSERMAGTVESCDHGTYTLAYRAHDPGRFELHVLVGGQEARGSPYRLAVGPGCRSGAVLFPCLGRGVCPEAGVCDCIPGYLGPDCGLECPGERHPLGGVGVRGSAGRVRGKGAGGAGGAPSRGMRR